MKNFYIHIILIFCSYNAVGQLLPGTLYGTAGPSYSQTLGELVTEAGEDDGAIGYETGANEVQISFYLDSDAFRSEAQNCTANVYRYKVFMHIQNAPDGLVLQARSFTNGGDRFPSSISYDLFPAIGPRNLYPENGGAYITLPTDASAAIKVFEFIGCRLNIPIQFNVSASALSEAGASNTEVYYTVVGSLN